MSGIFLSLAVLARDLEGAATLERALRSAIERPSGPMFDEIVVLLGGRPADRCREIASRLGCRVLEAPADLPLTEEGGLADFAAARNFLYAQCRGVWIAYIDADDVIPGSGPVDPAAPTSVTLKDFLRGLPHEFNSFCFPYHYAYDEAGNVVVESFREWARWRDGFTWCNRAPGHHEAIFPIYPNKRNVAECKGFHLEHRPPDDAGPRRMRRNDALLDAAKHIGADEWGIHHYLASQAERRNLYQKAVEHRENAAKVARNEEEKYTSLHGLARVLRYLGRQTESLSCALLAYNLAPLRGEALGDLVLANLEHGDAVLALEWYGRLLALPETKGQVGLEYNAYEVELWPHVGASRAFLFLERFDEAVAAADRALAFAPYDVGAKKVKAEAVAARDLRRARDAARFLLDFAARRDDASRVHQLFDALPYVLEHDTVTCALVAQADAAPEDPEPLPPTGQRLLAAAPTEGPVRTLVTRYGTAPDGPVRRRRVYTPARLLHDLGDMPVEYLERVPADDMDPYRDGVIVARYRPEPARERGQALVPHRPHVVFFCPETIGEWGPFSPERTGIGGSEEMVVQVARRLAEDGARVEVYAPVPDLVVDRGVVWRPFMTFDPDARCDVLISHRTGHLARRERLGAHRHYVWLHDAIVTRMAEDYEGPRQARVTAYLTLSTWQEDEYHTRYAIPREKMIRVPNTPDPDDVVPTDESGRRDHVAVYASAPYRGLAFLLELWPHVRERVPDAELRVFNGWEVHDALTRVYPEMARVKGAILALKDQPGVTWVGKLTAPALRSEFQVAGILAYPSVFNETSCRTAIRAMACGCEPVYRPLAALEETIGAFGVSVPGDPGQAEYRRAFADRIADRMLAPATAERRRAMAEDVRARHDPWRTWREIAGLQPRGARAATAEALPAELAAYHAEIGSGRAPEIRL